MMFRDIFQDNFHDVFLEPFKRTNKNIMKKSGCPLEDHPSWELALYTPGPSLTCWDDYGKTVIQKTNTSGTRADIIFADLPSTGGIISANIVYIPTGTSFCLLLTKCIDNSNLIGVRVIANGRVELVQRLNNTWSTVWSSGFNVAEVGDLLELIFRGTDVFIRVAGTTLHQYALPVGLQGDGKACYLQHKFDDADAALVHDYRLSLEMPALDWYVRPASGAPYGNGSGINYDNAWGGLRDEDWGLVKPGDSVYYSGYFDCTIEDSVVICAVDGSVESSVTISGSHADYPSAVIDGRTILAGTWTDNGDGTWYIDTSALDNVDPKRLWIDKGSGLQEQQEYETLAELSIEGDWFFDSANKRVHVFSSADPATHFIEIRSLNIEDYILLVTGRSYLNIENFTLHGGNSGTVTVRASGVAGPNTINIRNCNIYDGMRGLTLGNTVSTTYDLAVKNVTIDSCVIDANYAPLINSDCGKGNNADGVRIEEGCENITIKSCTVTGYGHSSLGIQVLNTNSYGLRNIEVYNNRFDGDGIYYCRGLAFSAIADKSFDIKVHNNLFNDFSVRSQFNGQNIIFSYNVYTDVRYTENCNGQTDISQCMSIGSIGTEIAKNIKIINNCVQNVYSNGLKIFNSDGEGLTTENIEVSNNIFYNCATNNSVDVETVLIRESPNIVNTVIKNNIIFSDQRPVDNDTEILYKGQHYSVSDWNNQGVNGDIIEDNFSDDPQLDGYHIPTTSPAYEAGIWISDIHAGAVDIDGDPVTEPVSIGCDEGT